MLKNSYHTLIIGGGPAGLAAAISSPDESVLVEKNRIVGKKLLLTGQGMCNFTNNHQTAEFLRHCAEFAPFLKRSFYAFDNHKLIELLRENGCEVIIRDDGKVFPQSLKSTEVRDTLVELAKKSNCRIYTRIVVKKVSKNRDFFAVEMLDLSAPEIKSVTVKAKKVIVTTGGCSYPQTGSDGSGYWLADSLGHTIIPIKPALANVYIADFDNFKNCAGNTLRDVKITFFLKQGKKINTNGDILFTHTGLSGPEILNKSYLLSKGDTVRVEMVENAAELLKRFVQEFPKRAVKSFSKLTKITQSISDALLTYLGIDADKQAAHLTKKELNMIISYLGGADFVIENIQDTASSMGTAGGVNIKEINPSTMESRLVKNLFFAGDVLSYSLPTGGYSIQVAFSTGWAAGKS